MNDYHEIIAALTLDYLYVYIVDPEHDTATCVRSNGHVLDRVCDTSVPFCYSSYILSYASDHVHADDRDAFLAAARPGALTKAFCDGRDQLELTYKISQEDNTLHHYTARFTRISKPDGALKLVAGFRNIDSVVATQQELHDKGLNHAYTAISGIYLSMLHVDLDTNTYFPIKITEDLARYTISSSDRFDENIKSIIKALFTEESYSYATEFLDIRTLERKMQKKSHISMKFEGKSAKIYRLHLIREDMSAVSAANHLIVAIEVLDEDKYRSVFDTLAKNFQNVFWVDLSDGTAKILKLDGYITRGLDRNNHSYFAYPAILKQYISERVMPEDKLTLYDKLCMEHLREVFSSQSEYTGNYRVLVNGEIHYYQFNYSKMTDIDFLVCGFQNIDNIIEEHLAEEKIQRDKEIAHQKELLAAKEEADRANATKTDFLLRMSHDIRTPLNGIIGLLDIADRFSDDLSMQTECRDKMRSASKILLDLINEVLDMSKLESGQIVLEHIPFDLTEVSRDVHNAVARLAHEKNITIIEADCDASEKKLLGSPLHLKRLMLNIIGNAVKYNKEHGKIYITCKETIIDNNFINLEFQCRDTGIGMSTEFLEHIFEPFSQEVVSARSQYGGTGLGMPIAKNLVEKMGGTITVTSTKGVGSTFDVVIPFEIDNTAPSSETSAEDSFPCSIQGIHILLAEDNKLNMNIATLLLETNGAIITKCWNGREAVDAFAASATGSFDIILMDVMMPVMNGYDAAKAIRAMQRSDAASIPIVAMTANAFTEDKLIAKASGMNDHLPKPIDIDLMLRTISRLTGT